MPSKRSPGSSPLVYRLSDKPRLPAAARVGAGHPLRRPPFQRRRAARRAAACGAASQAKPDVPFYTCDVRGIGESRPDTCGTDQFLTPYGSDYFYAIHAIMLDRPYVGQKTLRRAARASTG